MAVVGLVLSLLAAWQLSAQVDEQAALRLETEASRSVGAVEAELRRHVALTHAAAEIVEASGTVDQARWTEIAGELVTEDYPALFALNLTRSAGPDSIDRILDEAGLERRPPDPDGDRDRYAVITQVHPMAGNEPALGYDVATNPRSTPALQQTVDTGAVALSDGLTLVQETAEQTGLVAYQPFQTSSGELAGWVNAVVRGQDFLEGVQEPDPHVGLVLRDRTVNGPVTIGAINAVDREDALLTVRREIEVFGQVWDAEVQALPGFVSSQEERAPWLTLVVGLLLTTAIVIVAGGAASRERRANELAAERTGELSRANDLLRSTNSALEAASRAKDDFLAVISHEFRTPLTVIQGFATTLLEYRRADLDEATADALGRIDDHARRLDALVDDLLLASKLDSGTVDAAPEDVALDRAVREVVAMVEVAGVDVDVPADLVAHADPTHVERMLENLLTNAGKYGGPPIQVCAGRNTTEVWMEVRDAGDGVPTELVPQLFDRFAQAESGNARRSTGVGLGLAIVRDLARTNGGEAEYRGDAGGAVFRITLPAGSTDVVVSGADRPAVAGGDDAVR